MLDDKEELNLVRPYSAKNLINDSKNNNVYKPKTTRNN